jgi:hypothetical protein
MNGSFELRIFCHREHRTELGPGPIAGFNKVLSGQQQGWTNLLYR